MPESIIDTADLEHQYSSVRSFLYYMNRVSGEEWEKEQEKDNIGASPIRLEDIEQGIYGQTKEKMLIYESGRSDYRKISDIDLCHEIDRNIIPKYGKASVYHLSRTEKEQIGEFLFRTFRIGEAQIRRCLVF